MGQTTNAVEVARRVADEVLFPAALSVDTADRVPQSHLDELADAGLYGDLITDFETMCAVAEVLAAGCLTTTFVWVQHHGLVGALLAPDAPAGFRDEWLAPLCAGRRRAGLALAGLLPGPPRLTARREGDGWVLDGDAPWVTGWGLVDVLLVVARVGENEVVRLVVDARAGDGLDATHHHLVAANASATVSLTFRSVAVPAERVLRVEPYDPSVMLAAQALRANGSLALGVAGRCCRMIGRSPLDAEVDACRAALDRADGASMPAARAVASELAWRAAAALVVTEGSRSVRTDDHTQRLAREALFLLVFGTRPPIRASLLGMLGA